MFSYCALDVVPSRKEGKEKQRGEDGRSGTEAGVEITYEIDLSSVEQLPLRILTRCGI